MKLPAYARPLIKARSGGRDPWLVVVSLGKLRDLDILHGEKGVARIGWATWHTLAMADWAMLVGLDVVVSAFADASAPAQVREPLLERTLQQIFTRGKVATLWVAESGREASYLDAWRNRAGDWQLDRQNRYALNAGFRAEVRFKRDMAIVARQAVFADAQFDSVRADVMQSLTRHAAP
jgi:hypothetical protein